MDNLNGGTKFSRSALVAGRLRWTWLILVTSKIKPFLCFLISEQKRAADQIMMIRCSITLTYHERRLSFVVNGFCSLPFLNHQAVHRMVAVDFAASSGVPVVSVLLVFHPLRSSSFHGIAVAFGKKPRFILDNCTFTQAVTRDRSSYIWYTSSRY